MSGSISPAEETPSRVCSAVFISLAGACLAAAAVLGTLDAAGDYPALRPGPGVTLDEIFNVEMGVYHWRAYRDAGLDLFDPQVLKRVFDHPGYNADHPPLGRLWIGFCHDAVLSLFPPEDHPGATVTTAARTASAFAYAATVFLIGWMTGRWYGRAACVCAMAAYVLMPRVFAHAHIASLETPMNLAFAAVVFAVADCWSGNTGHVKNVPHLQGSPSLRSAALIGLLFGLALLTKIQAVLLPIPLALWALWQWRRGALLPLCVVGIVGFFVFFAGWPWLWLDPAAHLKEYFARTTQRVVLYCWYLGERYVDREVPWHYPFVMFAVTTPLGLHLLGAWPLLRRAAIGRDARASLLWSCIAFVLAFFAIPGITVYDGVRLFLVVYPLWAVLIGRGASWLLSELTRRWSAPAARGVVGGLFLAQAYGLVALHPAQLSYYNLLAGGLRGAARLGFETTYWQDSVTRPLLEEVAAQVPPGATIDVAPVLHPFQLDDLEAQSPILRRHQVRLRAYDDRHRDQVRYILIFRRRADPWASLEPAPQGGRLLAEVRREGVQLAALYELVKDPSR